MMMTNEPIPRPYRTPLRVLIAVALALGGCDAPDGRENRSTEGPTPAATLQTATFDQQVAEVQNGQGTAIHADESTLSNAQLQTLGTLTTLTRLELPRAAIDDAAAKHIASLANLEVLALGETTIGNAGWRRLMSLTKLKRLNVAKCEIDDEALRGISSLADLELLRVGSSRLTNIGLAEIAKLPKLRHLIIRFAPITDAGLKPLADLKGLESLYLEGTNVTEAGERELLRARPDLHIHFP